MLHLFHNIWGRIYVTTQIRRRRVAQDAEVNMTPMLDIVFIMLIFFIVTATFLDEQGLDFILPPDGPTGPPTPSILVYVDAQDKVSVNGVFAELSAVPLQVERLIEENPKATISLRAASQARLDPVVYLKDQMSLAGRKTTIMIDKRI